ncbi:MAG: tail fiber domain-containing protein [Chthoniobacterales bacterium]
MKTRTFLPIVAVLFAAFILPTQTFAQSANVRARNTNQSAKFKSFIVRGSANRIQSNSVTSFIGAGQSNSVLSGANYAVLGGGFGNLINNEYATVSGGAVNTASGAIATVGGGEGNAASGSWSTIAGGIGNSATGSRATIGGGFNNTASNSYAIVGGGRDNAAGGLYATIGGGELITAGADHATVAGGRNNTNSAPCGFIGGGQGNQNSSLAGESNSVVAGGYRNAVVGNCATVGGGEANSATAEHATVPGGHFGVAAHRGAFVWSGAGGGGTMTISTNDYSFTVRAPGGVRFISTYVDSGSVPSGTYGAPTLTTGVFLAPNSGTWASLSDSNAKTKVTAIKPRDILSKVAAMPVTEWQYKSDPDNRRYIGPMAQDFHAIFGLGYDDKSISTLDSDGVMYAAIQGLVQELRDRDEKIGELEAKNAELSHSIEKINERLNFLPPAP